MRSNELISARLDPRSVRIELYAEQENGATIFRHEMHVLALPSDIRRIVWRK